MYPKTRKAHEERRQWLKGFRVLAALAILLALVGALTLVQAGKARATPPSNLRIAVFGAAGTDPGYILAVERMFAAMGQQPLTIMGGDISRGRLTTDNFDVLVLPECEQTDPYAFAADGSTSISNMPVVSDQEYYVNLGGYYTGVPSVSSQIQSFVNSGGKVIALAGGANYITASGTWGDYQGSSHTWTESTAGQPLRGPLWRDATQGRSRASARAWA